MTEQVHEPGPDGMKRRRLSVRSPRACSGDMYAGVPRMVPGSVTCVTVSRWSPPPDPSPSLRAKRRHSLRKTRRTATPIEK